MSKIGTIKVEAIINPTNAELDLVDGVGEEKTNKLDLYFFFFPNIHLIIQPRFASTC